MGELELACLIACVCLFKVRSGVLSKTKPAHLGQPNSPTQFFTGFEHAHRTS